MIVPMGELILLRHGETEWSRDGRHTGLTDVPLTLEGEATAAALAPVLAGRDICAACTSPLQRAARTATLAGLAGAKQDPDLREWDYGGYEGVTTSQIREQRPGWYLWRDGVIPGDADHPGETIEQVAHRVGQQRSCPCEHPADPAGHLLDGLAGVVGVARDHAVAPQVPAGPGLPDLRRGQPLVAAVVPFPQVGGGLGVVEAGQGRGADRALCRAGEDGHDVVAGQQRGQCLGGRLTVRGERDVGPPGVPAGQAPLGLTVPEQDQLAHGTELTQSNLRSASRSRMLAWTLTRPDSHIRAMLAGVADSAITSSLFPVSLISAGGSSGAASFTGSAPCSVILVMNVTPRSVTWQLNERLLK